MVPEGFRFVARLVNDSKGERRLYLAPWGDSYLLAAGEEVEVCATGENSGLRIDVADEHITVWGWPEAVLVILKDGIPLDGDAAWSRARVPAVPPGVDVREFLELIRPVVDEADEEGG